MVNKSITQAAMDLFSTVLAGILKDDVKGLIGTATTVAAAGAAVTFSPAAIAAAVSCLAAYLAIKCHKHDNDEKEKQEIAKILRDLLRSTISTEHDLKQFLKERTAIEFDNSVDHNRILNRLKLLHNVCASAYSVAGQTAKREKTLQADLAKAIEANGQFQHDLTVFLENNFEWLKDDIRQLRGDLCGDIESLLHGRPILQRRTLTISDEQQTVNPFWFGYQWARFIGRDDEIKQLNTFLEAKHKLLWWCITGSGGAGKSRLALELCLSLGDNWYAGFLDRMQKLDEWKQWQPSRPTLIIIDYASSMADELGKLIDSLNAHSSEFVHPVRFLILERSLTGGWLERFKGTGGQDKAIWNHCRWRDGPDTDESIGIALGRLAPQYVEELIKDVYGKRQKNPPGDNIIAKMITRAGDKALPLYIALAADAMVDDGKGFHWDKKSLLENTLNRWKDKTKHAATAEAWTDTKYVNFLAFATITGGIERSNEGLKKLEETFAQCPNVEDLLPDMASFDRGRYELLCGRPCTEKLYGLEPDVLGECFMLDQFAAKENALSGELYWPNELKTLWQAAWRHNPAVAARFLPMTAMDFPDEKMLNALGTSDVTHNALSRELWAFAVVWLLIVYNVTKRPDDACRIYNDVKALAAAHETETALRKCQASAAVNLIATYGETKRPDDARNSYEDIKALSATYNDKPAFRVSYAKATFNLMNGYTFVERPDDARGIYSDLKQLSHKYKNEAELRDQQAMAAFNLLIAYAKAGRPDDARSMHDDIKALAAKHKNEPMRLKQLAEAGYNLAKAYSDAERLAEARAIYNEMKAFVNPHENLAAVRESQAKVGFNLTIEYARSQRPDDARDIYDDLKQLAEEHRDEAALREWQARAGINPVIAYGDVGRPDDARSIYDDLRLLADKYRAEPTLRIEQAKTGNSLVYAYSKAGRPDDSRHIYDQLKLLADLYKNEAPLRLQQVAAGDNLVNVYGKAKRLDDARYIYDQIKALAGTYKDEAPLPLEQAEAGLILVMDYCIDKRPDDARVIYADLKVLAATCKDEPMFRLKQAQAGDSLVYAYCKAERQDEAHGIYDDLKMLAVAYKDEPSLRECQAKVSSNLIAACADSGKIDDANVIYDDIRALAAGHKDESALRGPHAAACFNLASAHIIAEKIPEAKALLDEVEQLVKGLPDEKERKWIVDWIPRWRQLPGMK